MNVYQEIREIESQIKELNEKKKELERSLTSGFLESGGLALLQQIKWECYSSTNDYITTTLNEYTARIFRVKMGLSELWGSINLESERDVSLRINDDDELVLSCRRTTDFTILDIIRDYKLKLDLSKNRSSIRFEQMQLDNRKEDLAILEEFANGDEI